MTPLPRCLASAVLVAALAGTAHAQDATVRVRVDADDVVVHQGQAYYRNTRGRYERVGVQRDRQGRTYYFRVVPRGSYYYGGYGGNGFDSTEYRPPASRVTCTPTLHCTTSWYDPRYDRRLYRSRYDHGNRDRDHRDGDGRDRRGDGRRHGD